ncbi:MAG: histidine--tRNA ligase [Candidatus Acetothermia bacterium]
MKYHAPKGLSDILPEEIPYWQEVERGIRKKMEAYRYREIRTPVMEQSQVFARGVGEDTDIVSKEMYTFEDKGGRSITLRPENTASVVRAYLEHKISGREELSKFYYIGPMFRYEAPQKGRSRQFHQYGAEALGSADPSLDVELIELSLSLLDSFGVTDVGLAMNSIGCSEDREQYVEELVGYLQPREDDLCADCRRRLNSNPLRILDCKEEGCRAAVNSAPVITDYLCEECEQHFDGVQSYADQLGIDYQLDHTLVRGLDYYTKTVFELFSSALGAQDALIGGGRYDDLVELLGGEPTPAVGFAAGMERLILILSEGDEDQPSLDQLEIYIATLDERTKFTGFELLRELRDRGLNAEIDYLDKSLQGQLGYADRYGASYSVIIGPQELSNDELTLRDMESGEQQTLPLSTAAEQLAELVA